MEALGQVPSPLTTDQIVQRWGSPDGPLEDLVKAAKDIAYEYERLIQVRKAWYNWRFINGDQFLAPGFTSDWTGQEMVDFVTVDALPDPDQTGSQVAFAYPLNVVGGDCYKFMAVMGQSAPRVKAIADDSESTEQLQSATDADAVLRDAWEKLNIDQKWRILAFHQFTTGPTFVHTPWVTDAVKYGQSVEPKMEVQGHTGESGAEIPVPVQTGVQTYPNGDVEAHVYTVLEVSVPYGVKFRDECGWLVLELLQNKWKLIEAFPEKLAQYRERDVPDSDLSPSVMAAEQARDSVGNPSGIGRPRKDNCWRWRQLWVRPWMLESVKDTQCRETLKAQFPNGLYLAKVGDVTVDIQDRAMDDEWAICKTGRGEKILENPIASDSVPLNRALNDLGNLAIETVLRSIAKTIVDQMLLDRKSIQSNEALPAEMIFTTTAIGQDISKMIAQIPPARVSDQLVPLFQLLRALQQDITGIRPELSGGGQPTQTFREAKQRKDQALAQLSPQADEMQRCAETIGRNIVRQRAKYGIGQLKSRRKTAHGSVMDVVDLAQLKDSGWHVEADDNFPMTTADTADKLWGLLKEYPPEVQAALGILDPMNLERNLELLQLPGYESPVEDQKRKTLADIKQLLQGKVIQGPPGPDGQPSPPQSSVPVSPYDDHQFVADFVRKWMVSRDGQKASASQPDGFQNTEAFKTAHQNLATPPPPPPPPPVRTNMNIQAKMEDMGPAFVNEVLQGAGLPQIPAGALPPPQPIVQPGLPGQPGGPGGAESPGLSSPGSPDQESPIPEAPPLSGPPGPSQGPSGPSGPSGPQGPTIQ